MLDLMFAVSCHPPVFREVPSNDSLGVLVMTALPRSIKMRQVGHCTGRRLKVASHEYTDRSING